MCKNEVKRYFDNLLKCSKDLDIPIDYDNVNYCFIDTLDKYGICTIWYFYGDFHFNVDGSKFLFYDDYYYVGCFAKDDLFTEDEFELLKLFLDI